MRLVCWLALSTCCVPPARAQDTLARFGTTVVIPDGLRGQVYHIKNGAERLPDFGKLKPKGTIYTTSLNVQSQPFNQGFPGVSKRFEWFAIDYNGYFYISQPGKYRFVVASDDGSKLYIDDRRVIDNDGLHPAKAEQCRVNLKGGIHTLRLSYFQGPRTHLALMLGVARPGQDWKIFSTNDFQPPRNPEDWHFGEYNKLPPLSTAGRKK